MSRASLRCEVSSGVHVGDCADCRRRLHLPGLVRRYHHLMMRLHELIYSFDGNVLCD